MNSLTGTPIPDQTIEVWPVSDGRVNAVPIHPVTLRRCHMASAAVARADWLARHAVPDPPIPWRDLQGWAALASAVRLWWLWGAGEAA